MTFPLSSRFLADTDFVPDRAVPQLVVEARKARAFGKPLAAALMMALARVLPRVPALFDRLEHWPGDLAADGVVFRLNAGLHALALAGKAGALERLYGVAAPPAMVSPDRLDAALVAVLQKHHEELLGWLAHPTQTNETLRVAGLVAALLELEKDRAGACEVLELGASAGLNLNFPLYAVELGDAAMCAPDSPVRLRPEWRGQALPAAPLTITGTRGVDLHPLDVANPVDHDRLKAYVWPGETARAARLEAAIGLAKRTPPQVEAGLASAWLVRQLAEPQPAGVRRVVFHSMVLQYAAPPERAAIDAALALAGATATPDRPLARVGIEWRADRKIVEIRIAEWDGRTQSGTPRLAAVCHPYGEWIDWRGL
ncbi:DUF2332 family protein [Porphyrobacter sp. YT40]|uniref:DUF2332 family protein n=1 Tax=Porphyrobacter sp. YT40 TaxID=2547601 RepID=UPI001144E93A|nr:DUF2332 family protein [Porphyrobacter sp. YT40]QDH35361.1 DUF2332 family protein [Porphyrobacter sp. YT40]